MRCSVRRAVGLEFKDALESTQVERDVDQGVEVCDGALVAQLGPFDAEGNGLAEEALAGGALVVQIMISLAVPVELVADASPLGGRQGDATATFGPALVSDGASVAGRRLVWVRQ